MESHWPKREVEILPRSLPDLLAGLSQLPSVEQCFLKPFLAGPQSYSLPHYIYEAPSDTALIRLGIFGAIHGDEPAGAYGLVQFLRTLSGQPEWATGYQIHVYPVCNPTGFEDDTRCSRRGKDLNREFWKNSAEPEVQLLEQELTHRHFDGLIQLHADDTSEGLYGFVRGHTLTENLLRPALVAAGKILPRNANAAIDGFAAREGIIDKHYEGVLGSPRKITPVPFEIIFETPQAAPMAAQIEAILAALRTIMVEYRRLISFAQDI